MEVITTPAEYDKALSRAIEIFHAEAGAPESDELDILVPLIKDYEDLHYPIL